MRQKHDADCDDSRHLRILCLADHKGLRVSHQHSQPPAVRCRGFFIGNSFGTRLGTPKKESADYRLGSRPIASPCWLYHRYLSIGVDAEVTRGKRVRASLLFLFLDHSLIRGGCDPYSLSQLQVNRSFKQSRTARGLDQRSNAELCRDQSRFRRLPGYGTSAQQWRPW